MKKLILGAFVCAFLRLSAQSTEIGVMLGGSLYSGDIAVTPANFWPQTRPAFGFFGRYNFANGLAVRANILHGKLVGDEKNFGTLDWRRQRGFSFTSPITELSAQLEYKFLNFDRSFRRDRENSWLSFYAFGGVGGGFFNPTTDFNEPNAFLGEGNTDAGVAFKRSTVSIPLGLGATMQLSPHWSLGAEVGGRTTFSDYLDGISQTASPLANDYYLFGGLTLSYHIYSNKDALSGASRSSRSGKKGVKCPDFKH